MSLVKCPECGKDVEIKNGTCPLCGYPFDEDTDKEKVENISCGSDKNTDMNPEDDKEKEQNISQTSKSSLAKNLSILMIVVGITCFIIGSVFAYKGFDKKNNYYHSETYSILNNNAYVGGDAYNIIINGTYFAGYAALAAGMYVVSAVTTTTGLKILTEKEE